MYVFEVSIFVSFYDLTFWFRNCPDSVVYFVIHIMSLLSCKSISWFRSQWRL